MAISCDEIVPWGRSFREYQLMFDLSTEDIASGVLDCGGGPASFIAELCGSGFTGVSFDPIYAYSGSEIRARFDTIVQPMIAQVRATPGDWVWNYHRDPDDLCANRRAALERFLADYEKESQPCRYVAGALPFLPFADGAFGLAVCSHLLFLYSDLLTEDFHRRAVAEMCRVAEEVRIFPLLTLSHVRSPHLAAVQSAVRWQGWVCEIVRVNYELQRGGNEMLRIFRS